MARKTSHLKKYQFQKGGKAASNPPKNPKNLFTDAKQQFAKGAPRKSGRKR